MITALTVKHFKAFEDVTAEDLGPINVFIGRNNAGKSTVLHALDLAGLALQFHSFTQFPHRHRIEDMFWVDEDLVIVFHISDGRTVKITAKRNHEPVVEFDGYEDAFRSLLLVPDPGYAARTRALVTPEAVRSNLSGRHLADLNALDILRAARHYEETGEFQFGAQYHDLLGYVIQFFPELRELRSSQTEQLIATANYTEGDRGLDILYSGSGLKRILDITVRGRWEIAGGMVA